MLSNNSSDLQKIIQEALSLEKTIEDMNILLRQKEAPLKARLDELYCMALAFLNQTGQNESMTDVGGVKKSIKETLTINDDDAFFAFMVEHKAFDLLQRRITKSVVKDFTKKGIKVPGVKCSSFITATFVKPK